jgi:hypothetical protein
MGDERRREKVKRGDRERGCRLEGEGERQNKNGREGRKETSEGICRPANDGVGRRREQGDRKQKKVDAEGRRTEK